MYARMYIGPVSIDVVSVAELRAQLSAVLEKLRDAHRPVYVTQRGRPRAVLVSVGDYDALVEQVEYLEDSLEAIAGRERRRAGERTRSLTSYLQGRKRGRVPRRAATKR